MSYVDILSLRRGVVVIEFRNNLLTRWDLKSSFAELDKLKDILYRIGITHDLVALGHVFALGVLVVECGWIATCRIWYLLWSI